MRKLPGKRDLEPVISEEGERTLSRFLGLSFQEAESLFREEGQSCLGDLARMGSNAWLFYFPSVLASFRFGSGESFDWDFADGLVSELERRLDYELEAVRPSFPLMRELCGILLAEIERAPKAGPSALAMKLRCSVILKRIA